MVIRVANEQQACFTGTNESYPHGGREYSGEYTGRLLYAYRRTYGYTTLGKKLLMCQPLAGLFQSKNVISKLMVPTCTGKPGKWDNIFQSGKSREMLNRLENSRFYPKYEKSEAILAIFFIFL